MGIRHIAVAEMNGVLTSKRYWLANSRMTTNWSLMDIGETLGISSVEAARRYRAVGALKQMEDDELFSKKAEPASNRLFHELVALPGYAQGSVGHSVPRALLSIMEKARHVFLN